MPVKLTKKQDLFVKEFLIDLNATQAAIRAGYSAKRAVRSGGKTCENLRLQLRFGTPWTIELPGLEITADAVLQEIAKLAFANIGDFIQIQQDGSAYVNLSDVNRDQLAALTEIHVDEYTDGRGDDARDVKRVKIKMADKKGNLELLGRHLKLFTDRLEVENPLANLSDEELNARALKLARELIAEEDG